MSDAWVDPHLEAREDGNRPTQLQAHSTLVDLYMTWEHREDMFWSWWNDAD